MPLEAEVDNIFCGVCREGDGEKERQERQKSDARHKVFYCRTNRRYYGRKRTRWGLRFEMRNRMHVICLRNICKNEFSLF